MRPFSPRFYRTPVVHRARVVTSEDGDEVETWPGAGTALMANASQGVPRERWTQQVEESTTDWMLYFGYRAVVTAGIVIRRGDQLTITPAYGPPITLKVAANMVDPGQLHVDWCVRGQLVD